MSLHPPAPPVISERDEAYVRREFIALATLCASLRCDLQATRADIEAGRRPRPFYVLHDGTEFVANDYFERETDEGRFSQRVLAHAHKRGVAVTGKDVAEMWSFYLAGQYDACLRVVTPEMLIEKDYLIGEITKLLNAGASDDPQWKRELATVVGKLDAIERPFCDFDRAFFGGPVSRDIYITDVRAKFGL